MARVDFLKSRYERKWSSMFEERADSTWTSIISASLKTRHKYLEWFIVRTLSGKITADTLDVAGATLHAFHEHKRYLVEKDIYTYHSLSELTEAISQVRCKTSGKAQRRKFKQKLVEEGHVTTVLSTPSIKVYKLLSPLAASFFASGTRWCTKQTYHYTRYGFYPLFLITCMRSSPIMKGPLVFHLRKARRYQMAITPNGIEIENERGDSLKLSLLIRDFPELSTLLAKYVTYAPIPEVAIGMMDTLDDDALVRNATKCSDFMDAIPKTRWTPALSERVALMEREYKGYLY